MSKLALKLIEENKRTKYSFLDLGKSGLKNELPIELLSCTWLTRLNLGIEYYNHEEKKWEYSKNQGEANEFTNEEQLLILENLPHLESLNISNNKIQNISFSKNLIQLRNLDFRNNRIQDISSLKNLTQLQTLYLDNNQIRDISHLQSLKQLKDLNLNSNEINDYTFLQYLTELEDINLSSSKINECSFLQKLLQLQFLYLNNNQIQDIQFLRNLKRLQVLRLDNNFIKEIEPLDNLTQLKKLQINDNKIQDINFLKNLTKIEELWLHNNLFIDGSPLKSLHLNLEILYLGNNNINDITFLENLVQLKNLRLENNLIQDITSLQKLIKLKNLYINHNLIEDVNPLRNLIQLQELVLSNNQIQNISSLKNLTKLISLHLDSNQIQSIKFLEKLTQLELLNLNNNQIYDIIPLKKIPNLQYLHLNNNLISEIKNVANFKNDLWLFIDLNPIVKKYQLILNDYENHWPIIKNILDRENEEGENIQVTLPAKILLLGNHKSGKSSLVHYLLNKNLSYLGDSTHLLKIETYPKDVDIPEAIFYDFGGQDYYHGIYRAFLSSGSAYLLLWDKDKNRNETIVDSNNLLTQNFTVAYWLGQKRYTKMAHADPVLLIQTHASENVPSFHFSAKEDDFIKNNFYVSLSKDHNFTENKAALSYLKAVIDSLIKKKKVVKSEKKWYANFFKYILSESRIEAVEVNSLLEQYTPKDKKDHERIESLTIELKQFHNQGLVLYYRNIESISNYVWLNPSGLVAYIHQNILQKDIINNYKGKVPVSSFADIDNKIIALLEAQKVIFRHHFSESGEEEYIIPNFLPLVKSNDAEYKLFTFGLIKPLFSLKFENFLPVGIINQLICFFGQQPDHKKFWRNQLLFTFENKCKVLIQLDFQYLEIKVFVTFNDDISYSEQNKINKYLFYCIIAMYWDFDLMTYDDLESSSIIDKNTNESIKEPEKLPNKKASYEQIFNDENFQPSDLYISREGKYWVKYKDLFLHQSIERRIISFLLYDDKNISLKTKEIPVKPFEIFSNKQFNSMKKIFISYSKFDDNYRDEFQRHLINLKRNNLVEVFDDRQLELGDKWDDVLKQKIDECDYFICLVSVNFLNVPYIYEEEIPRAHKAGKKIIPIIIKPCDWISTPIKDFDDKLGDNNAHSKGTLIALAEEYKNGKIIPKEYSETQRDALWLGVVIAIREMIENDK